MCVCANKECDNWGICCLCVANHRANEGLTACMRTPRPEPTFALSGSEEPCLRQDVNRNSCTCTWDSCSNHAICCECIRNHWTSDGTGRPACLA